MSQQTRPEGLAERYGGPSVARRRLVIAGSALLAAVFLGWLAWVIWLSSDPEVTSQLTSFSVIDDHEVAVVLAVHLASKDVDASCTLHALAEDHSIVGQTTFTPDPAQGEQQRLTLRTDRRATSVESLGCTAPGQDRPR